MFCSLPEPVISCDSIAQRLFLIIKFSCAWSLDFKSLLMCTWFFMLVLRARYCWLLFAITVRIKLVRKLRTGLVFRSYFPKKIRAVCFTSHAGRDFSGTKVRSACLIFSKLSIPPWAFWCLCRRPHEEGYQVDNWKNQTRV